MLPKHQLPAKQLRGVEDPATVLLVPISFLPEGALTWWSHDGYLIGGVRANGTLVGSSRIGYLPQPIPRSWHGERFHAVVEYEAEQREAQFTFRAYYGCGDPSELHMGETKLLDGRTEGKQRLGFQLNPELIVANELFRFSLEIARKTPSPVLIYGAWLELGV